MANENNKLAIYDLNQYIWYWLADCESKNNNPDQTIQPVINENDYYVDSLSTTIVPIIPAGQVPEILNLLPGKSHIVYDYEMFSTPVQWWMLEERVVYTIFAQNPDTINTILARMTDLLRRFDGTAKDLNDFYRDGSDFVFHHISIGSGLPNGIGLTSASPSLTEAGMQEGIITVNYTYSKRSEIGEALSFSLD